MSSQQIKDILDNESKFNQVAKTAFDSVDQDKSGQIDSKELMVVMKQVCLDCGAEAPKEQDVMDVLNHLDSDKSGKLDLGEFKVLIRDVLEAMSKE